MSVELMQERAKALAALLLGYKPILDDGNRTRFTVYGDAKDGRQLCVIEEGDKWEVHPNWPYHEGTRYVPHDCDLVIRVSRNRGIEALAKDIGRKVLPTYESLYTEQIGYVYAAVERERARVALRDRVLDILDAKASPHESDEVVVGYYGVYKLTVNSADGVDFRIDSLSPALAVQLAEWLRMNVPKRPAKKE